MSSVNLCTSSDKEEQDPMEKVMTAIQIRKYGKYSERNF
ncbi:hypothetical protein LEP1GSC061_2678 [Leptospira wolffii serovar Khorat str. Khorat-H2]|nr:hypothetical protein LEP1GSC061_2678 [Leptospira wolffii serovar Khorat str. Khorat-H2]